MRVAARMRACGCALLAGTALLVGRFARAEPVLPPPLPRQVCPAPAGPASAPAAPSKEPAPAAREPATPPPEPTSAPAAADNAPSESSSASDTGEGLSTADSSVGYIDSAIPANLLRLRYDSAYGSNRAGRAEFFYARGGRRGPGLPLPEPRVDYQELRPYLEVAPSRRLSIFVEAAERFLNPQNNADHSGFGDMIAGFKAALVSTPDTVATLQFKTYAPTGDDHLGLGTGHVSLEPGLLLWQRFSERLIVESELRYWAPIGGTDFAGDVLRYGIGVSYGRRPPDALWLVPVVEFVGWTVLSGKEAVATSPTTSFVESAAGDTIVNVKAGLRLGYGDRGDFYVGYGRALTGDVWYKDIIRLELRIMF